jgi:UDP-N-acetylmuramate: L-alanyl-gamma-D-glutamyl-meso-diaminopimelate ligase
MFTPKHFHFIGIGGTAMGSTAVALRGLGHRVTGSDAAVYPPMSDVLAAHGIEYAEGYKADNLPASADCFVVGNAISRGNEELEVMLERKLSYTSMAELLKREVIQGRRSFVVSGTHGKTTTSSMLAWLFEAAGKQPGFMIGGVPGNFESGARFNESPYFVIEGDEYDTAYFDKRSKFVHYLPECVIVNNVEFDHADIFDDLAAIMRSFRQMLNTVPRNGLILMNGDDVNCRQLMERCPAPVQSVGTGADNDWVIQILDAKENETVFSVNGVSFTVPMIGEFNARNAAMCVCAARFGGLSDEAIREGLQGFLGIQRRQQVRGEAGGITVVDDFGHHPTALRVTLAGLRQKFPGRRLWALFEPRSNTSRRRVLQDQLIEALGCADVAVIASVNNPGKVPSAELLQPDVVANAVNEAGGMCFYENSVENIIARVQQEMRSGDVITVFSNGGFEGIHGRLLEVINSRL